MADSQPGKSLLKWPTTRKAFICNRCCQSFDTKSDLNVHMKATHPRLKLFYCTFCKVIFQQQDLYQFHLKICPGRTYKCNFVDCGQTFADTKQLEAHAVIHRTGPVLVEPVEANAYPPPRTRGPAKKPPKVIVQPVALSLDDGEVQRAILERYAKNH